MSSRSAVFAAVAAFALGMLGLLAVEGATATAGKAGIMPEGAPLVPAAVTPVPTRPLPSGQALLADAALKTRAMGSVVEYGKLHSSDNSVLNGRRFWANFSWKHHRYRDHAHYRKPTNLNSVIRYARNIRRIVAGPWIAIRAHKQWYCGKTSTKSNSGYWRSPSFNLSSPSTVGATQVDGVQVWEVQGGFVSRTGDTVSHLTVDVYLDQGTHRFVRVTESGTVHVTGVGSASITGQFDYKSYGKLSGATIPPVCKS